MRLKPCIYECAKVSGLTESTSLPGLRTSWRSAPRASSDFKEMQSRRLSLSAHRSLSRSNKTSTGLSKWLPRWARRLRISRVRVCVYSGARGSFSAEILAHSLAP